MAKGLWRLAILVLLFCLAMPVRAEEPEEIFKPLGPGLLRGAGARVAVNLDLLARAPARVHLPALDSGQAVAELVRFESRGPDDYTWRGRLKGAETGSEGGDVVLTVRGRALAGLIVADGVSLAVVPREPGVASVVRVETDGRHMCGNEVNGKLAKRETLSGGSGEVDAQPDPQSRIDLLVVYSALAGQEAGGTDNVMASIQNAVDATNTVYENSLITTRLRLVHAEEVDYDEVDKGYEAHLSWAAADPKVALLRDTYRADLVSLFVEREEPVVIEGREGKILGIAALMGHGEVNSAFASRAFSVVCRGHATDLYVLAHELGHNMGAGHSPEDMDAEEPPAFPFSYGHWVDGTFHTVMSYNSHCTVECPVVPYFSNPNLYYQNLRLGIAEERDNHRTINATDQVVASFRKERGPTDFYTVSPCRVVSTLAGEPLVSGATRIFAIAGACQIPATAEAVAANITVVGPTGNGNLVLFPGDLGKPLASTINFSAGVNRANAAVVSLATNGSGSVAATPFVASQGSVHLLIDVVGYYERPGEDIWIPQKPLPLGMGRSGSVSAVVNGRIYVIGGNFDSSEITGLMESYDPISNQWRIECSMPTPRVIASAAAVNGKIYVIGGQGPGGELSVVEQFDPSAADCGSAWSTRSALPGARSWATAAEVGGRIYVIGGSGPHGRSLLEYDPGSDRWTEKSLLPSPKVGAGAAAVNGTIFVIGGGDAGHYGGVLAYDAASDSWSSKASMPIPSSQLAAAALGGKIYVVGGDTAVTQEYDPATNTWTRRWPIPTDRLLAVAGVVGGRLYVIGGYNRWTRQQDTNEMYLPPGAEP